MDLHSAALTGTIADRYEIRREVGRGGMAVVYLAWDLRHDRPVALKVLRPEVGGGAGSERFLREIQITAHLSHPHILTLIDSGLIEFRDAGSRPFYVMMFVDGPSLADRLESGPRFPTDEALRIAADIADALHYAHSHGVIHRDIKPANIMLQDGHAMVADFGVARSREIASTLMTTAGMAIGTVTYMSPEQLTADPDVDGRSDIYSLGCVLYELLSGSPPFAGSSQQEICARHLTERPRDLRHLRPDLTPAIQQVVERALAKRPEDRFASAADFRDALIRLRNTGETALMAPTHRRIPAVALLAVVILAGLLWWRSARVRPTEVSPGKLTRLLVVPFQVQGHDSLQLAADAITQSLTDHLQAVPDLAVTAYAMVAPYRGASLDSLGRRFPVDHMIAGTVAQVGDSLAVTARLLNPTTGQQLRTLVRTESAASSVTAIVDALGTFVKETLWRDRQRLLERQLVQDDSSLSLVEVARVLRLQAQDAVTYRADRAGFSSLDRADSLLLAAQRRDRTSVLIPLELARTAYSRAYLAEYIQHRLEAAAGSLPDPALTRSLALARVNRFLDDHPRNVDALTLRGMTLILWFVATGADQSLAAAIADLEQATTLDPLAARSLRELSRAQLMAGHYPESMLAIERATRTDPFQVNRKEFLRGRFEIALLVGDFAKADIDCHTGLHEFHHDERFLDCHVELWGKYSKDVAHADSAFAIISSLERAADDPAYTAHRHLWVSAILARAGLGDSADRVAARVFASLHGKNPPSSLFVEAGSLRLLRHDPDSALALIAAAVQRNPGEVPYLRNAPWFKSLRQDPRFAPALRGISPREAAAGP